MSTSWTWDHKSAPSLRRPDPCKIVVESKTPYARLRRHAMRYVWMSARLRDCVEELFVKRAQALLLHGDAQNGGGEISCLYVGTGDTLEYMKQLLYAGEVRTEALGRGLLPWAPRLVARHEARASLVVVDVGWPFTKLFSRGKYLETPSWVNQSLPLADTWEETAARLKSGVKRNHAQRSRKHRLVARITHDDAAARSFYHGIFVPHLVRRFGAAARIEPEESFVEICREDGLLEVSRDGVVLGASVLVREAAKLRSAWSATREELDNQLTSAVFGALYYFTITFGHEQGFELVDYCDSRSTLNDGVLAYKRQWGARVRRGENRDDLLLRPRDFSPAIRNFFVKNPFLVPHGSRFRARVLRDDKVIAAADLQDFVERNAMDGIVLFDFCSTQGFAPSASEWAQRESRVRLVDLSRSSDKTKDFCRDADARGPYDGSHLR